MPVKLKLIDIKKLKKSSQLVLKENNILLEQAKESIKRYEEMMKEIGMDRKKLRKYLNHPDWPAHYRKQAVNDLTKWKEELKNSMDQDAQEQKKQIKLSKNLLDQTKNSFIKTKKNKKLRTGFI